MLTRLRLQARITAGSLRKSGARSLVAIAAMSMGIAAMMITLALSEGARSEMEAINDRMGKNLFVIGAARVLSAPGRGEGWFVSTRLEETDVALLRDGLRDVTSIVPIREASVRVEFERRDVTTTARATTPGFLTIRNFRISDGRFFDDGDGEEMRRVAVIGSFLADKLDGGRSMVGETVRVAGVPFEVIGQLESKGMSSGQNEDDQILIPLQTGRRRLFNSESLSRLLVQVGDARAMDGAREEARALLRESHRLNDGIKDDFEILSMIQTSEIRKRSNAFVQGLSRLFAALTLTIGSAGVLAVTFLNVKDRIPEIGLRMAVGARRRDIAALFLAEACLLGILGGAGGVTAGAAAVATFSRLLDWRMVISLPGVVLPFVMSVILGVVFGVGPAVRAASVIPVEALKDR